MSGIGERVDYIKAHLDGVGRGEWGEAHILALCDASRVPGPLYNESRHILTHLDALSMMI